MGSELNGLFKKLTFFNYFIFICQFHLGKICSPARRLAEAWSDSV